MTTVKLRPGQYIFAEPKLGATPTHDQSVLENLNLGGHYWSYKDINWGPHHESISIYTEPTRSALALGFKQSPSSFKMYKCNSSDNTALDEEVILDEFIYVPPTDENPISSKAYIVPE